MWGSEGSEEARRGDEAERRVPGAAGRALAAIARRIGTIGDCIKPPGRAAMRSADRGGFAAAQSPSVFADRQGVDSSQRRS
jgi:hypothetical protein